VRIQILSDTHNEFQDRPVSDLGADLVILAGDIHGKAHGFDWARRAFKDKPVLYVAGNHEFYGTHIDRHIEKMRAASCDQMRFLEMDEVITHGIRFLGGTAWTDFMSTGNSPLAQLDASMQINDYRKIRTGVNFRKIRPGDTAIKAFAFKSWLRNKLATPFNGKTVVITHHAPTLLSLSSRPATNSHLDAAFANRWDDLMGDGVDLWVHGHTHMAVDYTIGGTRVVSNPMGYSGEYTEYNPDFEIGL